MSGPRPFQPDSGPGGRPRLSLCVIARDAEADLPACLASAAGLADEVVVVDTGSADRTREVAAAAGARVFDFPWCDDFSAARNESLRRATGDWVLWLDCDERLDKPNRDRLGGLLARLPGGQVAFVMRQRSPLGAGPQATSEVDQVRLFRRHPAAAWAYRVHEQILPALGRLGVEVRRTDVVIAHAGYEDAATRARKLGRNLRLLRLDAAERPGDPFVLFNLGWALLETGEAHEAAGALRRSLAGSKPGDSITRKLYVLLAQAERALGRTAQALALCQEGLARFPGDPELLHHAGLLRYTLGDLSGAVAALERLLVERPLPYFAVGVEAGLGGYLTRHNLAVAYRDLGRLAEAEGQWWAALAERPGYGPALLGLGEVLLRQGRWAELEAACDEMARDPRSALDADVLRARGRLERGEFAAARRLLEGAAARAPGALAPRVLLSRVLLREGRDAAAAERALRAVLELDPGHAEARRNLEALRLRPEPVR